MKSNGTDIAFIKQFFEHEHNNYDLFVIIVYILPNI